MKDNLVAIAGAIVGGAIGFFLFQWLVENQGLYGLVLPGGLLGIGASFTRNRSIFVAVSCGIAAIILGIVAEWSKFPFNADPSFGYFILHLYDLRTWTIIMISLGGIV